MLNKAGRNTAPFHLELKQTRQKGAGASHWATEDDCTPEEPDLPFFPARSARSLIGLVQVHPDENALPATVPRNRGAPGRQNRRRSGCKQPAAVPRKRNPLYSHPRCSGWLAFLGLDDLPWLHDLAASGTANRVIRC